MGIWVLANYHIKEDKLDPRARKGVFIGLKKRVKSYKIWDPKDRKFILSRDVMFDEASMMKPTNSQQVKSQRLTGYCSKWRVMLLHHL